MARLSSGIAGPISGKIGAVVGATWKDVAYVRSVPKRTAARSEAQKASSGRFALVNKWLEPFKPFTSIGLMHYSGKMTAYNAAYRLNYGLYPQQPEEEGAIDYSRMVLSDGPLKPALNPHVAAAADRLLHLRWDSQAMARADDELLLLIYCPRLKAAAHLKGGVCRADGQCMYAYPDALKGETVEVFIGFVSADRKKASRSQWLGRYQI